MADVPKAKCYFRIEVSHERGWRPEPNLLQVVALIIPSLEKLV